ncbi:acyl carrier protein [Myxosarcina sp. GI1]|uniref:acyl carrier protein n=1 Tax=Myxosarcina sp. GI1 TaxID=1541065 RepID=UPI000690ABE6|nr:acyl carrier protein [Myxosarcina sp. GI1]
MTNAFEAEDWETVKEISAIFKHYYDCTEQSIDSNTKICLKVILSELIRVGDWHLVECFTYSIKENFYCDKQYHYRKAYSDINIYFKKILTQLVEKEDWYLIEQLIDLVKDIFTFDYPHTDYLHSAKANLKQILRQSIEKNNYDLAFKTTQLIEKYFFETDPIRRGINEIIVEQFEIEREKITSELNLRDLEHSELCRIELIMAIEEGFDVEICDQQADEIVTVKDLYDVVTGNLEEKLITV